MPATIPLSKGYNIKKLKFPVHISEKLDGVPVKITIYIDINGNVDHEFTSRSGKPLVSVTQDVHKFVQEASTYLDRGVEHIFVAEVTHKDITGFKNISGTIRRHEYNEGFVWNFFDYAAFRIGIDTESDAFYVRTRELSDLFYFIKSTDKYRVIDQKKLFAPEELETFLEDNPIRDDQEGWVIRSYTDTFEPDKRSWGYQKIVAVPTEDLPLVKVDEAISKDGVPLGMAGKLWCRYNGNLIGVGPGALTHPERKELFENYTEKAKNATWPSPTIQVAYKKDDTYTALREARFECFRPDKD